MKNILSFLAIFFLLPHISWSQNNVTFQLDMSTVDPTTFTTPEVNGSFNSWCGNCAAMTDPDGDNVWEITVDLANGSYEFKYSADNWSIQESLLPGSFCTNTTGQYTNRVLNVSGDTTLAVVCWESCSNCSAGPSSYDVTFEVDMRNVSQPFTTPEVNGNFNGWCGNCWQMSDADGDSVWQFQMLFAPGDSIEWKYSADNWSIQEDLDSSLSCITINYDPGAPNGWGFVNRIAVINSDTTFSTAWNSCDGSLSIISGCTDPLASNYNPLATVDDGSCLYSITFNVDMNCEDSTSFGFVHLESPNFGWCGGCVPMADPDGDGIHSVTVDLALGNFEYKYAVDNFAGQEDLVDDMLNGATCAPITDYFSYANRQVAINPGVTTSDTYGSCSPCLIGCTSPFPTNLSTNWVTDSKAGITWDNMNDSACMVLKYFVRYRELGTSTWTTKSAGVGNGLCNFGLNTTTKTLQNLTSSTTYEYKMKAFYCGGTSSNYSAPSQFTTADDCPPMTNLTATTFNGNQAKVRFDWDSTGAYVFARVALRVDTVGANWQTAGGFGVYYPALSVNKFGLQPGESYRAQGRTFCDSNITSYRSWWTSPIFWTQPGSIRMNGGTTINNLDVYPNPTDDIFNVSFVSEEIQTLSIRVLNIVGEVIYEESLDRFVGEYTKQISLGDYSKGIYFLEINDTNGTINKKIILQ